MDEPRSPTAAGDRRSLAQASTDELVEILLDRLAPAVATYRREVAQRAGLGVDELLCLEQLRRHGRSPASRAGRWLGVTRTALSRILRRLEDAGHVERRVPSRRGREVEVSWRPMPARDAVLDELRARVRRDVADLVVGYRLDDPDRHALVAWFLVQVTDLLARHARHLVDSEAHRRLLERRRRERAAAPDPWRGR